MWVLGRWEYFRGMEFSPAQEVLHRAMWSSFLGVGSQIPALGIRGPQSGGLGSQTSGVGSQNMQMKFRVKS